MAKSSICKECKHLCGDISYNGLGEPSIWCGYAGWPPTIYYHEIYKCDGFELPDYNKDCWKNGCFKPEMLPALRSQICLGSIYISDYRNEYGIDPAKLIDIFDAYVEWLDESGIEDSAENLIEWYDDHNCILITEDWVINEKDLGL